MLAHILRWLAEYASHLHNRWERPVSTNDQDAEFEVVGEKIPGRAASVKADVIEANIAKARQHPGQWCVIHTYDSINTAATMRSRLNAKHAGTGIEFASRTYKGKPRLLAKADAPDTEGPA